MTDPRIEAMAEHFAAVTGEPRAGRFEYTMARAALAAADKAATIKTAEELDALPEDAVILAGNVAYQKCGDHWDGAGRTWDTVQLVSDLPARVIHWGNDV